jgi:serine/threonine protein kinase
MDEKKTLRVQPRKWNVKSNQERGKVGSSNPVAGLPAVDFLQFYTLVDSLGIESVVDEERIHEHVIGLQSLGVGASVKVRRALHPQDRSDLVLKSAAGDAVRDREARSLYMKTLITELRVMSHPPLRDHPNIASLLGLTWHCDESYEFSVLPILVLEYSPLGTLNNFLNKHLSLALKKQLCLDVANGLKALHVCRILHSDVKSENILVFGSEEGEVLAKVSDFGSALLDYDHSSLRCRVSVTRPWNAPETEYSGGISPQNVWKTDIFSYGMLCWRTILDNKFYPFTTAGDAQYQAVQKLKNEGNLIETAVMGLKALNIVDETHDLLQILEWTLQLDPDKRVENFDKVVELLTPAVAPDKSRYIKYVFCQFILSTSNRDSRHDQSGNVFPRLATFGTFDVGPPSIAGSACAYSWPGLTWS